MISIGLAVPIQGPDLEESVRKLGHARQALCRLEIQHGADLCQVDAAFVDVGFAGEGAGAGFASVII